MRRRVEGIEFPGVLKNGHMEIPGGQLNGSWFSILEFPRSVIQVSRKVYSHPHVRREFLQNTQ